MDYFRKKQIQEQLDKISEKDWNEICSRCKRFLNSKLFNKTSYGAHSEHELGGPAVEYYLHEAILKIYTFNWEWKFERYSMTEQIIRLVGSLISKKVDKYRSSKEDDVLETELNDKLAINLFDEVYDDKVDELIECIERIVKDDIDLKIIWESTKEGFKSSEIAELFEKPVKYIYRQNEKLIYHAKTKCLTSN